MRQKFRSIKLTLIAIFSLLLTPCLLANGTIKVYDAPTRMVGYGEVKVILAATLANGAINNSVNGYQMIKVNGQESRVLFSDGKAEVKCLPSADGIITIEQTNGPNLTLDLLVLPAYLSLLPPFLAIGFALVFKEVMLSLLVGIFSGSLLLTGFRPLQWIEALVRVFDHFMLHALADSGHAAIILFSVTVGGMVAVVSKNGGMAGVVSHLAKFARTPLTAQLFTYIMGIAIFFDDYSNTLVVGNTMRPVTDKLGVSREKLAFLVDTTAAPVASIAIVTTWIGVELAYIKDATMVAGINESAYSIFLNSLKYSFYPILMLVFVLILIILRRDYGPMALAENKARRGRLSMLESSGHSIEFETFMPKPGVAPKAVYGLVPVLTLVSVTLIGLVITGINRSGVLLTDLTGISGAVWQRLPLLSGEESLSAIRKIGVIIGNADAYVALLWSSSTSAGLAIAMSVVGKRLALGQAVESFLSGVKAMVPAMVILTSAWAIAQVTSEVNTANYISGVMGENVSHYWMPLLSFIISALIAFSTGTSWGTMAIMYPLLLPAAYSVAKASGLNPAETSELIYHISAVILGGAVMGDHCSPISDTTIMSSLASRCNHIAHVKTQMPYALTVGLLTALASGPFWALGIHPLISMVVMVLLSVITIRFLGRKVKLR